jgi:hypothetical protein
MVLRQRLVRHGVAVIGAGLMLAGCGAASSHRAGTAPARGPRTASTSPATTQPASHVQPAGCMPAELRLVPVFLSPMTGEHGSFHKLVDHGRRACTLEGYPRIRLYAHGVALPFRYSRGGGTYVTRAAPRLVTLRPGGAAWFLVAKYRCDLGTIAAATSMTVTLPGAGTGSRMPGPYSSSMDYCRAARPTRASWSPSRRSWHPRCRPAAAESGKRHPNGRYGAGLPGRPARSWHAWRIGMPARLAAARM